MKATEVVDGYTILRKIGNGGMGEVWLVEKNGIEYAMKICMSDDEEYIRRIDREYRLMSSLDHENVLKAYEHGDYDGKRYIILQKADCNLEELVNKGLTTQQKFIYTLQICEGLSYVHKAGESHRDIKPSNVFVKDKVAKVADFGLGRFLNRDSTSLTSTADKWGTYGYAAPELFEYGNFKEGSPLIDIYALGCLIYYVFSDGSLPQFKNHKMVSSDIYPVITKCTENEPSDRYQSVDEVNNAINAVLAARSRYASLSALAADKNKLSPSEITENALPLFFNSGDIENLFANFKVLKSLWSAIYQSDKNSADKVARYILDTWDKDQSYWLQFEDTEIMADMAVILCPLIDDASLKAKLFDLCFSCAVNANRWNALRNINDNLIKKWDEKTISPYISFITSNKDLFSKMSESIGVPIPGIVQNLFT